MTTRRAPARRPGLVVDADDDSPAPGKDSAAPAADGPTDLPASLRFLQRENSTLRFLIAIHDRLGALVLHGASPDAVTEALADLMNRPVLLLDQLLRPVRSSQAGEDRPPSPWDPNEAYVARVLHTMAGESRSLRLPPLPAWGVTHGCVLAPVLSGEGTLGYLAILDSEGGPEGAAAEEVDLLAVQHAASVCALALMRERIAAEVSTELKDELLEGLLLGEVSDEQAARERVRRLGYDESLTYRALVLVSDRSDLRFPAGATPNTSWSAARRLRLMDSVAQLVRARSPQAIVTVRGDELVVLVPETTAPDPADLGRTVVLYLASLYPDWPLTVGIGAPFQSPTGIGRSYAQARRATEVALRFGKRGEVVRFEDLGLYRLLFQVSDRAELRAFVDQVLGKLLDYDRKHHTDLVRTIGTYLRNNNSMLATSRELFVHVNTVAYRIQRIQAVTELDLTRTEDSLLARVALMILDDIDVA
jgi:PucR family transcriptional regulator, purine catabolism regulatory protein